MRKHKVQRIACGDWGLAPQLVAAGIYYVAFSDQEKSSMIRLKRLPASSVFKPLKRGRREVYIQLSYG